MNDIFDAMHRGMFEQLFSLDDEGRKAKAQLLREAGVPEEMIAELTQPGIQPGMSFGGAKPVDVMNVVERVLFRQHAGSVLLRIKRPPFDEAGHIEIEVLEIGPVAEGPGHEGGGGGDDCQGP